MRAMLLAAVAGMVVVPSSAMAQERQKPQARAGQSAEIRRALQDPDYVFGRMDTNGDGVISKTEFRSAHGKVLQRIADRRERRVEHR